MSFSSFCSHVYAVSNNPFLQNFFLFLIYWYVSSLTNYANFEKILFAKNVVARNKTHRQLSSKIWNRFRQISISPKQIFRNKFIKFMKKTMTNPAEIGSHKPRQKPVNCSHMGCTVADLAGQTLISLPCLTATVRPSWAFRQLPTIAPLPAETTCRSYHPTPTCHIWSN